MGKASVTRSDQPSDGPSLPNPFQQRLALIDTPHQSASQLRPVLPVHTLAPQGDAGSWWHSSFTASIGSLVTNASVLGPMHLEVEAQRDLIALVLQAGSLQVEQGGQRMGCSARGLLLIPGQPWCCRSSSCSLVLLRLDPQRLKKVALSMAEQRQLPPGWKEQLERGLNWQPHDGLDLGEHRLQTSLGQVLTMASELFDPGEYLVARLELDLLLYRLLAALMIPDLQRSEPLQRLRSRHRDGSDRFEELITYLEEHLHEPLSLHQLEVQSHYSRRALQYAFLERLGCSPTQWIRAMRLDRARRCLQHPQPGDTVTSIALACGYRSLNLFTVDFQQRFHVKPSELLREAHRARPEHRPGDSGSDDAKPLSGA